MEYKLIGVIFKMLSRESKSDETCRLRLEEKFRLFFSVCFILIFFPDKQDFPKSWTVWLDRLNFCRWNSKDTVDKKFNQIKSSRDTREGYISLVKCQAT